MTIILDQNEVSKILTEHLATEINSVGEDNIRAIKISNMMNDGRIYDVIIDIDLGEDK